MNHLTSQTRPLRPRVWKCVNATSLALRVVFFAVLFVLCGVGVAGVALPHLIAPSSLLAPLPAPASLPTTPPGFGLRGQATCRTRMPPTTSSWLAVAVKDAQQSQLDSSVFAWQIWQESRFMPDAISSAGAIGIAQFKPETAADMGINPHDPAQALEAATLLDAQRVRQYAQRALLLAAHYGGSSVRYAYGLTLAAYNAGAGAVEEAWKDSIAPYEIPLWPANAWDWLSHLGQETRQYVPAILGCL